MNESRTLTTCSNRQEIAEILNCLVDEVPDNLTVNSANVFASRYLLRDLDTGKIKETMDQLYERIAKHIALVDVLFLFYKKDLKFIHNEFKSIEHYLEIYNTNNINKNPDLNESYLKHFHKLFQRNKDHVSESFDNIFYSFFLPNQRTNNNFPYNTGYCIYLDSFFKTRTGVYKELISSQRFLPNTPTIMNAGTDNGQLCACYVLGINDNIQSIMKAVTDAVYVAKGAGGIGINFSKIRPDGDRVGTTPNSATGPMSFAAMIDFNANKIKQGGKRRAANMMLLNSNHPDIEEFITMKQTPGVMENFNVSVAMNKDFWNDYDANQDHKLINPRDGKVIKTIGSHDLFNLIAESAWKSAEPGMVYFDNANKFNPLLPILGELDSCNPCSEQIMYPNNSCTLGSIDLAKYVDEKGKFQYSLFKTDVYTATRFLDNVIDINDYPTPELEENSLKLRRIGLGYMGLAHALYKMGIQYNSQEGFEFIERISTLLTQYSCEASVCIAEDRGAHFYWNDLLKEYLSSGKIFNGFTENNLIIENWLRERLIKDGMRNTWTTTIAPTGTISMAADTSSGVEPIYSLAMSKTTSIGKFNYKDKEFVSYLKKEGLYSDELMESVAKNHGSCKGLLPEHISNIFVTAVDIHWLDHLIALAMAQRGISNSISKTINLPRYTTVDDLKLIYLLARYMGIKGVSVYRDGSREKQVLDTNISDKDFQKVGNNKEIGQKALKKDVVIETKPSSFALEYVFELVKKMNKEVGIFVLETLKKNSISYNQQLTSNTQEKCPLCESSMMVKDSHCTKCLNCEYGYCA